MVPKEQNPKGLALFGSAIMKLADGGIVEKEEALNIIDRLIQLRSPGKLEYCWGYNFDWQTRAALIPKHAPNIISTTFAGNLFLDAYEQYQDTEYLKIAISAGKFILSELLVKDENGNIFLSYTSYKPRLVHNANFLGAAFLARLFGVSGDENFMKYSIETARCSIKMQSENGSWRYDAGSKNWVDGFHTGYNLVSLKRILNHTGFRDALSSLELGFNFYINSFFTREGLPKYYHNRTYPIDIHSVAQGIVTLVELREYYEKGIDLAVSIFLWAYRHMRSNGGQFYFQKRKLLKNKISYMRWSQAWMLYSLAVLAEHVSLREEGGTRVLRVLE
jgi:hypothetical protein